jgi:cysteine dioxygenase
MKILQGQLKEILYDYPNQELVDSGHPAPPNPKRTTLLAENEVSYISSKLELDSLLMPGHDLNLLDNLGLHKMVNPSTQIPAVSLHLYTPPAKVCHVFNKITGQCENRSLRL